LYKLFWKVHKTYSKYVQSTCNDSWYDKEYCVYIHVFILCFVVNEDTESETDSDFDQAIESVHDDQTIESVHDDQAIESVHDEIQSIQVPQEKQQPEIVHR